MTGPTTGDRRGPRRPVPTDAERNEAAAELSRVRDAIDELDKAIVELLNERATLGRRAGRAQHLAGRRAIKDPEREREVLIRVALANEGPLSQADLLSIYRRVVAATRGLESRDRTHDDRAET
jgi:chorismate mutase